MDDRDDSPPVGDRGQVSRNGRGVSEWMVDPVMHIARICLMPTPLRAQRFDDSSDLLDVRSFVENESERVVEHGPLEDPARSGHRCRP
jgi:hypothetical protein